MKKIAGLILLLFVSILLSSCAVKTLQELPAAASAGGVEETLVSTSPAVFPLGSDKKPREVRIKVGDNNSIAEIYTSLVTENQNRKYSPAVNQIKFTNVQPGKYYLNVKSTNGRWAVENEPPVAEPHRKLTFNVWISVNSGPWVVLGSADSEQVAGQWWNLALYIP